MSPKHYFSSYYLLCANPNPIHASQTFSAHRLQWAEKKTGLVLASSWFIANELTRNVTRNALLLCFLFQGSECDKCNNDEGHLHMRRNRSRQYRANCFLNTLADPVGNTQAHILCVRGLVASAHAALIIKLIKVGIVHFR